MSKAGVFKILGQPGQISKILSTKTQRAGSVAPGSTPVLQMQPTATHRGSSLPRWALLLLQRQPKALSTRCFAGSDCWNWTTQNFPYSQKMPQSICFWARSHQNLKYYIQSTMSKGIFITILIKSKNFQSIPAKYVKQESAKDYETSAMAFSPKFQHLLLV